MQTLRYLPLAALAGVQGFAMFLPYLALICAAAFVSSRFKGAQPQPNHVPRLAPSA